MGRMSDLHIDVTVLSEMVAEYCERVYDIARPDAQWHAFRIISKDLKLLQESIPVVAEKVAKVA